MITEKHKAVREKMSAVVDPVKENIPADWSTEKQIIAKDAMQVLVRHYPGWKWGIEYSDEPLTGAISTLIIRLMDLHTEVVYQIRYKDIDRDRMHCVMLAGGTLLDAHGLSRTRNRHDEVHGLVKTRSGLVIPDHAAIPETNPGYQKIKEKREELAKARAHEIREGYLLKHEPKKFAEEYEQKNNLGDLNTVLEKAR
jgi:hypothetical protein